MKFQVIEEEVNIRTYSEESASFVYSIRQRSSSKITKWQAADSSRRIEMLFKTVPISTEIGNSLVLTKHRETIVNACIKIHG